MFDKKSDYALNKRVMDAIVYISATGAPALLTRADFISADEFQQWKAWSDSDYKETERSGRGYYDNCISLDERMDSICSEPSLEDEMLSKIAKAECNQNRAALFEQIKNALTEKQYRRLWMYHVDNMTYDAIACTEGVKLQSISESIASAEKKVLQISKYY